MGWNGSKPSEGKSDANRECPPSKGVPNRKSIVIVGIFAVLTIILALVVPSLFQSEETVRSSPAPVRTNVVSTVKPTAAKSKPKVKKPEEDPQFEGRDKSRIRRAANGKYVYLPARGEPEKYPGERAQALALIGGSNNTVRLDYRIKEDPDHPFMFHNQLQSDLVQFARPGEFAVPINPNISDEVVWQAIKEPIVDHENDSDRQLEEKQYVRDLLADLKKYMEGGGHAKDYFQQLSDRQQLEEETMKLTRNNVREMINAGELENAKKLQDEYNRVLREKGLPPMSFKKLRNIQIQESNP